MARLGCVGMGAVWLVGCSGETVPRPPPEVCDDGIDNDGDKLVDCDDDNCGGLPCQDQGPTDTDDTDEPPIVELILNDDCCDFSFQGSDCPQKLIGSVSIINRDPEIDGDFNISCDTIGASVTAIEWKVVGGSNQTPFLVNLPLAANSTVTVEAFFVCDSSINQSFDTVCNIKAEVDNEIAEIDHPVHANSD